MSKMKSIEAKDKLTYYVMRYRKFVILNTITGILSNLIIVLEPIFQGKLLDTAIQANHYKQILFVGLQFFLVVFIFQILRFIKRHYSRYTANYISRDIRMELLKSIINADVTTIEKKKIGDMMSTVVGDVDVVAEMIRRTIAEIWNVWLVMSVYIFVLMMYDVKITLFAIIPIPIVIVLTLLMKKVIHRYSLASRKANANSTTQIRKMIYQMNLLRLYGREEAEISQLELHLNQQAQKASIVAALQNGLPLVYTLLATVGIVIVIYFGGNKVITGAWTIGTFIAYINIFLTVALKTTAAAKVFNIKQNATASWDRIKDLLHLKENIDKQEIQQVDTLTTHDLSFQYPLGISPCLKNIDLKVNQGMLIGITGPIGCGKTAMGLALTGYYGYEGTLLYNEIEAKYVQAKISYMGHDSDLFSGTIEENITFNTRNDAKLQKIIEICQLQKDIEQFEKGLQTEVGENGIKLSGGQKQRIALARALYKDADIIILDDPFSAIDVNTELKIIQKIRKMINDKIIFIFSHRLKSFEYASTILVLENGQVAESGNHEELLKKKGIYYRILQSQITMEGKNEK